MKQAEKRTTAGFTLIEVMMSLVILATLMTAVAFAFDAAVTNYQVNRGIYQTVNTGRQALLRVTNDLRTASEVALIDNFEPTALLTQDPDTSQIGLLTKDGFVWYIYADKYPEGAPDGINDTLCLEKDGTLYTLCDNVTALTFDRTEYDIERDTDGNGIIELIKAVRDVRIVLTVTDESGDISQTLAAATLVRKNQ